MAKSFKLSSIGGLVIAGAGLGLYLGSSAISEINPAHYGTPFSASSFHGDLVPNRSSLDSAQSLPDLAQVVGDLGSSCIVCGLAPDAEPLFNYPSPDSSASDRPPPAEVVLAQADAYVSRGLSASDARDIERYAHFRVSQDEEPAHAVADLDTGSDEEAEPAG